MACPLVHIQVPTFKHRPKNKQTNSLSDLRDALNQRTKAILKHPIRLSIYMRSYLHNFKLQKMSSVLFHYLYIQFHDNVTQCLIMMLDTPKCHLLLIFVFSGEKQNKTNKKQSLDLMESNSKARMH